MKLESNETFLTPTSFQIKIEEMVNEGDTYLEAVIAFCDENDLEFTDVKKLLTTNLRDKIKVDAQNAGLMLKEATLQF